ncbi:hypothetical protein [Streptomyces sp. NPDC056821]|uniref:hypothetical protein n=1 Tax=unclassified Streptomyces TaxID=2593676 RepID=UPI0036C60D6F
MNSVMVFQPAAPEPSPWWTQCPAVHRVFRLLETMTAAEQEAPAPSGSLKNRRPTKEYCGAVVYGTSCETDILMAAAVAGVANVLFTGLTAGAEAWAADTTGAESSAAASTVAEDRFFSLVSRSR